MTGEGSGGGTAGPGEAATHPGAASPTGSPADELANGPWIVVAAAGAVAAGEVVEATLEGADVVVWRTESGVPCVMEARCPHQWSHLGGSGAVAGEEIVCLTHFWTFATDGSGWKENLDGRRDRKGDIEVYPCREVGAEIWVRRSGSGETR